MTAQREDTSAAAASAITRRIMIKHTDLLAQYGPEKVMQAIDDVSQDLHDLEEIGSSDVSAWVESVTRNLESSELHGQPPFVRYMLDFYGEHGIYKMDASVEEIKEAISSYKDRLAQDGKEFVGDSVDREAVRDIMIEARSQYIAKRGSNGPSM